jgi:hypothetical protein
VIGYMPSQVKDDEGKLIGAVMYSKDPTQVEQLEERTPSRPPGVARRWLPASCTN